MSDAAPRAESALDGPARLPFPVRILGFVLTIAGTAGAIAAFVLIVEKIALLKDPTYTPTCSINPVLSCGSVMTTAPAEVFGFPNPLLGLAAFPVVAAIGVFVLVGAELPRWMWLALNAGALFGVVFTHWLIYQSLYRIGALCPYCMVVWIATIVVFWYTTLHNLQLGQLPYPSRLRPTVAAVVRNHTVGLTLWLLLIAALIGVRFWEFWRTLA